MAEQTVVEEVHVAEVEEVVGHQPVVDVEHHPVALAEHTGRPGVEVGEVGDERGVGGLLPEPDPDGRMALLHGERADVQRGGDAS